MVASAKQKLRLWDVADQDIDAIANADKAPETIPFRNPADGDVVDKMVVQGSAVQAGMKVMRIEDHTKLWLTAQVYEDDMSRIAARPDCPGDDRGQAGQDVHRPDHVYPSTPRSHESDGHGAGYA